MEDIWEYVMEKYMFTKIELTDRSDLVAGYVGQTALKVHEVVQKALGGVLFIDEAYTLAARDDRDPFGREALDTLMKLVEDHRDDLVVILAGYPQEMEHFLSHNPGIRSRFPTVIVFEDYTVAELLAIADRFLARAHLDLDPDAQGALREQCARIASSGARERGNGRAVRNVMERAVRRHALRLMHLRRAEQATGSPRELSTLTADDFALDP
jgi:stage V sporulation protein K